VNRIPEEAYQTYISMGPARTYAKVAQKYGVSRRAVTKKAAKEKWSERLAKVEAAARDRFDEKLAEDLDAMNSRHLKTLRLIQGKAIEALRALPLHSAAAAARALDTAIARERQINAAPETVRASVHAHVGVSLEELVAASRMPPGELLKLGNGPLGVLSARASEAPDDGRG
jgi:hypothetical protein